MTDLEILQNLKYNEVFRNNLKAELISINQSKVCFFYLIELLIKYNVKEKEYYEQEQKESEQEYKARIVNKLNKVINDFVGIQSKL